MPSYVTQKEFADLTGVSKQHVAYSISKGLIKTKKIRGRKKVVLDDPVTQLWYEQQKARNSLSAPTPTEKDDESHKTDLLSLQQQKTQEEIKKLKADVRLKQLKYDVERGNLIDKDSEAKILFQYLNALNINMLDIPDMVIDTMIDKIKAGAERGVLIKIMRDMIQSEIKNTKTQIKERMK